MDGEMVKGHLLVLEAAAKEAKRLQADALAPEVSTSASASGITLKEEFPCMKKKSHYFRRKNCEIASLMQFKTAKSETCLINGRDFNSHPLGCR